MHTVGYLDTLLFGVKEVIERRLYDQMVAVVERSPNVRRPQHRQLDATFCAGDRNKKI